MAKMNHISKVLTIIASVSLIGYFLEPYRHVSTLLGDYFEVSTELLPLVLSFSIFAMTWFAYRKSTDDHSFFLGASFFIIGLLELFQILSHPFMPNFITPNTSQKAATFRIGVWLISALLFFISAHIYKESLPGIINKYVMVALAIVLSLLSLTAVLFYPNRLPAMYYPDGSHSSSWMYLGFATFLILLYTIFLYAKRFRKTREKNIICLIYGFIIMIFSIPVYFYYIYSGYLLVAAGFYFIYLALFKSSIERPYEKLADAEQKLRFVAEEKYRNLFDNANDAIIITDLEDRVTSWNRSAENIFGWAAGEIDGVLSQLIVPTQLRAQREQIIRNIISGTSVAGFDTVCLRKDGNEIDVSMTMSPIRNSEQTIIGLSSIIRDITERKLAEEALQESEDRYRRLVELSPDAIVVHSEGKILFINTAGAKLLCATSPENLAGRSILDFVHPDYREIVQDRFKKVINEGKHTALIEERFIRLDGTVIDIEEVAMPFTYQGKAAVQMVIHDITERKLAVEALKHSEEHFRSLIENSSDIITILNDARVICYLSPSVERSLGYKSRELTGKNMLEIIHPEDLQSFTDVFIQKNQNPESSLPLEVRVRHKDGSWRVIESIGKRLPQGLVVTGIVLNSRDITERKRAEEQIRASLAEKEVLLREIHHRVKNNMQVISSLLNLQSEYSKEERVIEMFKESRNRIISMSLVHEKLYQSKNFTKIDLGNYIKDLVNGLFQSYGMNSGKVALNMDIGDVSVGIDSAIPCGLIVNELVTNSLKHAFPGDRNGEVRISLRSTGEKDIELIVADNGAGIPKDMDIRKVKSLGLHLVNILAKNQLHGEINLSMNKGTEFQIKYRDVK